MTAAAAAAVVAAADVAAAAKEMRRGAAAAQNRTGTRQMGSDGQQEWFCHCGEKSAKKGRGGSVAARNMISAHGE